MRTMTLTFLATTLLMGANAIADEELLDIVQQLTQSDKGKVNVVAAAIDLLEDMPGDFRNDFDTHLEKCVALLLLGDARAANACPLLVKEIEFRAVKSRTTEPGPIQLYPAAQSLANIGEPGSQRDHQKSKRSSIRKAF